MEELTKKDISEALIDFYEKFIEPEFRAIRIKLIEHDQTFKNLIDRLEDLEERLETFS